jgi:hypothetical protein
MPRPQHALIPAVALAVAALAGPAGAAADAAAAPPWHTVPAPRIPAGDDGNLLGVSMTGPANGWAVGFVTPDADGGNANDAFTAITLHWDGHRWRTVPVRPVAHGLGGGLNDVAALSGSDVWAVGASPADSSAPMILHWRGLRWARVRSAPVPGFEFLS